MNAVPAPRHRPLPWLTGAALVAAGVLLVALWDSDEPRPQALPSLARPAPLPHPRAIRQPPPPPAPAAAPRPAPVQAMVFDGAAPDLRWLHDEYADSGDPRARRMAARAFQACVPLFVAAAGETPSPEALIASLPAAQRYEREQALRTLFARCQGFAGERPEVIAAMQAQLRQDRAAQDLGTRAGQALVNGDPEGAARAISAALSANDPAAVASLGGIAVRLARLRADADPSLLPRAAAIDAALPLVACDFGLDCSAQSLAAMQLCAIEGACDGDLAARLATRFAATPPDPAMVEAERTRLRALLASGRPLAANDLLP